MSTDYGAIYGTNPGGGGDLVNRALDHAIREDDLTFGEAVEIHTEAIVGRLRAAVQQRRAEQATSPDTPTEGPTKE